MDKENKTPLIDELEEIVQHARPLTAIKHAPRAGYCDMKQYRIQAKVSLPKLKFLEGDDEK